MSISFSRSVGERSRGSKVFKDQLSEIGEDRLSRAERRREYKAKRLSRKKMKALKVLERDESYQNFKHIIDEIMHKPHVCDDSKDYSLNPSYTKFEVPYFMQCRDRYVRARDVYEEQFQREISLLLENHTSAYEVARAARHLGITTLWPPLHNEREIITTQRYYFRLKPKQRSRLNYIMTHDFN